ncbi:hypothetical protein [Saccharothrix lopnurensis]|uniref:Uncharacterized protein n=1 Tax=Saccharothrix lopnurensis TaxID=1670621 RepID=A0ABW1P985_9PSEU
MVAIPVPSRAWLRLDHGAVPVTDAPLVTTPIAGPTRSRAPAPALARVRTATRL